MEPDLIFSVLLMSIPHHPKPQSKCFLLKLNTDMWCVAVFNSAKPDEQYFNLIHVNENINN